MKYDGLTNCFKITSVWIYFSVTDSKTNRECSFSHKINGMSWESEKEEFKPNWLNSDYILDKSRQKYIFGMKEMICVWNRLVGLTLRLPRYCSDHNVQVYTSTINYSLKETEFFDKDKTQVLNSNNSQSKFQINDFKEECMGNFGLGVRNGWREWEVQYVTTKNTNTNAKKFSKLQAASEHGKVLMKKLRTTLTL